MTPFTRMMGEALFQRTELPIWLQFINFNDRSLVGGLNSQNGDLSQEFLDRLLDRMLGGTRTAEIWSACDTCNARTRCEANHSVRLLRKDNPLSTPIRKQLAAALQVVHQQGRFPHYDARTCTRSPQLHLFSALTIAPICTQGSDGSELRMRKSMWGFLEVTPTALSIHRRRADKVNYLRRWHTSIQLLIHIRRSIAISTNLEADPTRTNQKVEARFRRAERAYFE